MNKDLYDGLIIKPSLDELYHHGVQGQKWGVRNGPPYPLSRQKKGNGRLAKGRGSITKKNKKSFVKVPKKSIQEVRPYDRNSFSKAAKVANSEQDMFNDILDRAFMDQDRNAIKDFNYEIKRVAKENGIDPDDLETIVNEAYNNREKTKAYINSLNDNQTKPYNKNQIDQAIKDAQNYWKDYNDRSYEQKSKIIKDITSSKEVRDARQKMHDADTEWNDFNKNDIPWLRAAARIEAKRWGEKEGAFDDWYIYDDGDQGPINSYSVYLISKGINPNEYKDKLNKASNDYWNTLQKSIEDRVGIDNYNKGVTKNAQGKDLKLGPTIRMMADNTISDNEDYNKVPWGIYRLETMDDEEIQLVKDYLKKK